MNPAQLAGAETAATCCRELPCRELPDTRNWRPTSDVTVTLDGAISSPQPVRFVRHRTLAESFQHASRIRRGSHRRTAATAEARRRVPTSPTTTTRRRSNRLESATWRTFSHDLTGQITTYGAATGTDDRFVAWSARVWRRGSFSARRRRGGDRNPRPPAAPKPRADDHRRELPVARGNFPDTRN